MFQLVVSDLGTIKACQNILTEMPGKIRVAVRNASMDAIKAVKAEIPRAVNKRFDITKAEVRRQMRFRTISQDQGAYTRYGVVVSGKRIPVMKFNVQPKQPPSQVGLPVHSRPPVSVTTLRGQPRVGRPNRFVVRMPSGHIGVYMRKAGSKSLPIRESVSESVPEMLRTNAIRDDIQGRATKVFVSAMDRNIKAAMRSREVAELARLAKAA